MSGSHPAASSGSTGSHATATPTGQAASQPAGGPVPSGFAATSVTFVSASEAFVLGTAPCATPPCTSIVRTLRWPAITDGNSRRGPGQLLFTQDGGAIWRLVHF